ncbi:MAG TPA: chemotaxis protein CheW [Pyrinomonadaceae bacterium]
MTEDTNAQASESPNKQPRAGAGALASPARRALIVARAGQHRLAVFADESEGVSKFADPAPLPSAPPAVLGVVAVRGRMRTLIDPLPLLQPPTAPLTSPDEAAPTLALLLKGDEQLALAVAGVERAADIPADSILPLEPAHDFARGTVTLDGAHVLVLDPARLFEAAMRGHERRRGR